ncbi:MAG: hypothetical protein HYV62_06330 [Candidatus Rokubacteria bacterium]|nr:hypothetical protein [Candidatus Rokubacteria bacterium]
MATKRGKRSGGTRPKVAAKAARIGTRKREPERREAPGRRTAPVARPVAGPSPLDRAERLRDDIVKSKLTAPDPWAYTPKARAWGQRAQELLDRIARDGATPALARQLEALAAEAEADRDFQEAKRLF